jgi:hypothetical protein
VFSDLTQWEVLHGGSGIQGLYSVGGLFRDFTRRDCICMQCPFINALDTTNVFCSIRGKNACYNIKFTCTGVS